MFFWGGEEREKWEQGGQIAGINISVAFDISLPLVLLAALFFFSLNQTFHKLMYTSFEITMVKMNYCNTLCSLDIFS